jgi:hypothetical protein
VNLVARLNTQLSGNRNLEMKLKRELGWWWKIAYQTKSHVFLDEQKTWRGKWRREGCGLAVHIASLLGVSE